MRRYIPLLALLLLCLFLAIPLFKPFDTDSSLLVGKPFGEISVASLTGKKPFSNDMFNGHVTVINAFASWCKPCVIEHPTFMKLSKSVRVYGLAWKDKPENIRTYVKKHGNPYSAIGVDTSGKTTTTIGLSGVPETFVLDQHGIIRYHYKSVITEDILKNDILPLIEKLNAPAS